MAYFHCILVFMHGYILFKRIYIPHTYINWKTHAFILYDNIFLFHIAYKCIFFIPAFNLNIVSECSLAQREGGITWQYIAIYYL